MDLVELLERYQRYNPETGDFDRLRTNREYAEIIGVHESYLSRCYDRKQPVNLRAMRGLASAFPAAATEITAALAAAPTAPERDSAPVAS